MLRRRGCELSAWWTGIDLCGCVFLILIQYGLDIDIDDGVDDDDDGVYVTLNTNLFLKSSSEVCYVTCLENPRFNGWWSLELR